MRYLNVDFLQKLWYYIENIFGGAMCKKAEMEFSIFMIHQLAKKWHITPADVYCTLNKTKILDNYIIKYYDVLHTQGEMALVEDISDFVREKGIAV